MAEIREAELTQEEIKSVLDYNPTTGVFTWKVRTSIRIEIGNVAGSFNKSNGYLMIGYSNSKYLAHRLAWIYVYGDIPNGLLIDHIDTDKLNNRVSNLRACTQSENYKNVNIRSSNTSGYKGVSCHKETGKWRAEAWLNGVKHSLGLYLDKEDASKVYNDFCKLHHGDFYRDTTRKE